MLMNGGHIFVTSLKVLEGDTIVFICLLSASTKGNSCTQRCVQLLFHSCTQHDCCMEHENYILVIVLKFLSNICATSTEVFNILRI